MSEPLLGLLAETLARPPIESARRRACLHLLNTWGDPDRLVRKELSIAKRHSLAPSGELLASEAEPAVHLPLEREDAAKIDPMLEEWFR